MTFEILEVAHQLVSCSKEVLNKVKAQDRDLERQLRRALSGVPGSIAEGNGRGGRDRPYHFGVAAGSAKEVLAHLRTAVAFGYVDAKEIQPMAALIDRVGAMAYRLIHPRPR